ncbi:MAG: integration host factor subunit beta [Spirochaetes bacterium]|nr:MAG: integration host factor subunit beta [Spirochaetota bacterium]
MSENKLTKAEIIDNIYNRVDIKRKDIHKVLDEFFKEVKDALVNNRSVELRGFGTFEVRLRKGREKARNPKTGETVPVSDHGVAVFRPGRELKKGVWSIHNQDECS